MLQNKTDILIEDRIIIKESLFQVLYTFYWRLSIHQSRHNSNFRSSE